MVYKSKGKKKSRTSKSKSKVPRKGKKMMRKKRERTVQRLSYRDSPFPPVLMTKMKYTDYLRITTSASTSSVALLHLNDINDPVQSGWTINGQPFYHDQLLSVTGPYYKNTVYGAKVKIAMTNNSSTSTGSCLINWASNDQFTSPASPAAMVQYAGEENISFFPNIGVNGNETSHRVFKKYFDIAKIIGITKQALFTDDRYSGAYNASPVFPVGLQVVSCNDATSAATSSDIGYVVKITFYVKLWSLSPLETAS